MNVCMSADRATHGGGTPRKSALAVIALALVTVFASVTRGGAAQVVDAVIASVDGKPITLLDLDHFADGRGRLLPPEERRSRRDLLEALIRSRMFAEEFEKNGIHAEDEDVEAYIDSRLVQTGSSRADIEAALARMGLKWEDYFERMREEVQRLALINREIRAKVTVSPEEVRRAWKTSAEYETKDRVEIGDIYLPLPDDPAEAQALREQAREVYELARRGGFGEAARKYSKGPTASAGGHLGVFDIGALSEVFAREVAKLDEGEVSEPFEVDGAIHLLKVFKRFPPGRVPLEEVREEIYEKLYDKLLQQRYERWMREDLRRRHHVTVQIDDAPWRADL